MKTLLMLLALAAAAASAFVTSAASPPERAASTVIVRSSAYGRILFNGRGRALYAFTRDPHGRSVCSGACAAAWPPYLVPSRARAGNGVKGALLGTTKRANGKIQVTYGGRPLYYYVGDRKPGQVLCQNVPEFGGLWLVLRASGKLVK